MGKSETKTLQDSRLKQKCQEAVNFLWEMNLLFAKFADVPRPLRAPIEQFSHGVTVARIASENPNRNEIKQINRRKSFLVYPVSRIPRSIF